MQMLIARMTSRRSMVRILESIALLLLAGGLGARVPLDRNLQSDPWLKSQVIQPADLAKELGQGGKREIVCVGFDDSYRNVHIAGATYYGPASKPPVLEDLKKWARNVPRGEQITLYCGCCPMDQCPNIRPAFQALKEMGFTNLRILSIPTDFRKDWVDKGFPVEKAGR